MSTVTNVVLQLGISDHVARRQVEALNFSRGNLVCITEGDGGRVWGGSKMPEVMLFAAAFNDIDVEEVFTKLLSVKYDRPEAVRLFIQEQHEEGFGVWIRFQEGWKCVLEAGGDK